MESFEYAPWVVLFSLLMFIFIYGGCILGQQLMKFSETGKDSLILFSTERTYRSFNAVADYVLLFTRFVSFAVLLDMPIVYFTLESELTDNIWFSFRIWNYLLVVFFFALSLVNSIVGLFLPENFRCCLTTSSSGGYYYYAFFMQMLFVVSGATSLFITVMMYWFEDSTTSFEDVLFNIAPSIFMVVEMFLGEWTGDGQCPCMHPTACTVISHSDAATVATVVTASEWQ